MMQGFGEIFEGETVHLRKRPKRHFLRYRQFLLGFDLGRLEHFAAQSKVFSHNRFNLFSLHDIDHGFGDGVAAFLADGLARLGVRPDDLQVRLICLPRILGYVFNPISVWLFYELNGKMRAVIYEVHNTFGQRHAYVSDLSEEATAPFHHGADKSFHVSPFMPMDLRYAFTLHPPDGRGFQLQIVVSDAQGPLLMTRFSGAVKPMTDATLIGALFRHPFLTLKVISGIHWEALKLALKGVRLQTDPGLANGRISLAVRASTDLLGRVDKGA